ncbi:MAG: glycogen synthase [Planctomycetes bacterium]|nr:glycogen synthase [Planctomycetota bacterium]
MKIAFVTPELQSLVRRTNLAEISESLPRTLVRGGHDVRVFLPKTCEVDTSVLEGLRPVGRVRVRDGEGRVELELQQGYLGELPVVLVCHERLFGRRQPYGDENGPYADNWRRYAVFARAVLEALGELDFKADLLHCFDWTTGLIPVFRELEYAERDPEHPAARAGVYFAIHNLAMQGTFEREVLPKIGIPLHLFQNVHGVALDGRVNFLKAGAEFATILGTPSPTQAKRIQETDRGYGLEDTFARRKKEIVGVSSGIDYATWDPEQDSLLPATFSASTAGLAGKRKNKQNLQTSFKLDKGPRTPVVGVIGRFDADSGCDLLAEVMTDLLERNFEVVMMGQGQAEILERVKTIEATFSGRCRLIQGYHVATAHLLLAGADVFLLPAHYQPSNALCAIAMRYGAVPVIYEHAGLDDLLVDYALDAKGGTGFTFKAYNGEGLLTAMDELRAVYKAANKWKDLTLRCMKQDFSWEATGEAYLRAYRRVTRRVRSQRTEVP